MLEPENNPNPPHMVDPPRLLRFLMKKMLGRIANTQNIQQKRDQFEAKRRAAGQGHEIEYFHQLDDPYSHLMAQVLAEFAARYEVTIVPRLVRATGGKDQPEEEKLAKWARRDAELIAPYFGLQFPSSAGTIPDTTLQQRAASLLAGLDPEQFIARLKKVSTDLWNGSQALDVEAPEGEASAALAKTALDEGSARLVELNHYSGATLYYGGEWYWGVDRLFHLEQRLRDLGACKAPSLAYLTERPSHDVSDVDASALNLHFFPSLNSPYTSIIFDRTIEMAKSCAVTLHHKPVLPMIMRGVAASNSKGRYIFFDTKREADFFAVPFGNHVTPIGTPTRRAYSLLPWAMSEGKDIKLLSVMLRHAWSEGKGLHKQSNMRKAVEEAGLDWNEATKRIGSDDWKALVESHQDEMVEGMGLWGVPSYRLSGPSGEPDLEVWGQDRLWLVAAEIRRRAGLQG